MSTVAKNLLNCGEGDPNDCSEVNRSNNHNYGNYYIIYDRNLNTKEVGAKMVLKNPN